MRVGHFPGMKSMLDYNKMRWNFGYKTGRISRVQTSVLNFVNFQIPLLWVWGSGLKCKLVQLCTSRVLCHNPPLPGLPGSRFTCLEPQWNQSQHKTNGALVHSNSSMIQLLLYDVITSFANWKVCYVWILLTSLPLYTQPPLPHWHLDFATQRPLVFVILQYTLY